MKKISATRLRSELYRILDEVLETGEVVEVTRAKGTVILRPATSPRASRKTRSLSSNKDLVVGDPDELIHFDWSSNWKPFL